jgi:hypothetical protein
MIEDNQIIVAVFLDFKRAFETIDPELLLAENGTIWYKRH